MFHCKRCFAVPRRTIPSLIEMYSKAALMHANHYAAKGHEVMLRDYKLVNRDSESVKMFCIHTHTQTLTRTL